MSTPPPSDPTPGTAAAPSVASASLAAAHWRWMLRRPATAVWLLAGVAGLMALWAGGAFLVVLVMSVAMATLLWPLLIAAQRVVRVRAVAAALVVLAASATAGLMLYAVGMQASESMESLPEALRLAARDVGEVGDLGSGTVQRTRAALGELDRTVARVTGTSRSSPQAEPATRSIVQSAVERLTNALTEAAADGIQVALQFGVVVLLTFFLLCSGERLAARASAWVDGRPLARGRFSPMVSDLAREVRRYGAVTMVINLLIGVATAAGLAAFGVDDAAWWGVLAAALHFIPYVGLAITMVLAALEVYVVHDAWGWALLAAGYIGLVGTLLGTLLMAWMQGRASHVDGAVMFGGTVFFTVMWGGWGLVLGPLMVVATRVVIRHARDPVGPRHRRAIETSAMKEEPVPSAPADGDTAKTSVRH